uniref:TRAF-type domain-containing protein n=1 Tax=Strigamia maritima TaxID=126957 RepID=T1J150_STRMM
MDSLFIICIKCRLKSRLPKDQLSKKYDGDSHSDKQFCSYCNITVDDMTTIQNHYDICDMYPISCYFCSHKFIRRTIKIHAQECLRTLCKCKFSQIGCQFQGSQLEIERHEGDNNVHVELMMNLLLNLQTEVPLNRMRIKKSSEDESDLKKIIKNQEMEINVCKKQMIDLKLKMEHNYGESVKSIEDLKVTLKTLNKQQTEQCDNVANYETTLTTVITASNQLTKSVVEGKKILSEKINAISAKRYQFEVDYVRGKKILSDKICRVDRIPPQPIRMRRLFQITAEGRGHAISAKQNQFEVDYVRDKEEMKIELKNKVSSFPFIWRVDGFAQLRCKQQPGYSQPFFTDTCGYEMRLELYRGFNNKMNVDLQVLDGPFDAILKWPIKFSAKIIILDQLNRKDHLSNTIASEQNRSLLLESEIKAEYRMLSFPLDHLKPLYLSAKKLSSI